MPMSTRPFLLLAAATAAIAMTGPALAQTASVEVTHDHPTGVVEAGEVVQISVRLKWTGDLLVHSIVGDAIASPDLGTASNQAFLPGGPVSLPLTIVNLGVAQAGSVLGIDIQSGYHPGSPNMPIGYAPWVTYYSGGMPIGDIGFLRYDWTAPSQPGVVNFDWVGAASKPDPLFYKLLPLPPSLTPTAFPTTYTGTSLTVIPAPSAALFLLGATALARRRR